MIIAVASVGPEAGSRVEERFGRAPYFVIHDTDSSSYKALSNTGNAAAAHGAGTGTAQTVISEKAEVVVAGRFGPKAESALTAAGIRMISWSQGTVADAVAVALKQKVG